MNLTRKFGIWTSSIAFFGATLIGGVMIGKAHASTKWEAPILPPLRKMLRKQLRSLRVMRPSSKQAMPEVVNIASSRTAKHENEEANPLFDDPFLRQFFW